MHLVLRLVKSVHGLLINLDLICVSSGGIGDFHRLAGTGIFRFFRSRVFPLAFFLRVRSIVGSFFRSTAAAQDSHACQHTS